MGKGEVCSKKIKKILKRYYKVMFRKKPISKKRSKKYSSA